MAATTAVADVQTARVCGRDSVLSINSSIPHLVGLFATKNTASSPSGERSPKRRKLDCRNSLASHQADVFDEGKSVVLGRVTLDLVSGPFLTVNQSYALLTFRSAFQTMMNS